MSKVIHLSGKFRENCLTKVRIDGAFIAELDDDGHYSFSRDELFASVFPSRSAAEEVVSRKFPGGAKRAEYLEA